MSVFSGFMGGYGAARRQRSEDDEAAWMRQARARQQAEWGQSDEDRASANAWSAWQRDRTMQRAPIEDAQNDQRYAWQGDDQRYTTGRRATVDGQADRRFAQQDALAGRSFASPLVQSLRALPQERRAAIGNQALSQYGSTFGVRPDVFGDYSDAALDAAEAMFLTPEDRDAMARRSHEGALRPLELQGARAAVEGQALDNRARRKSLRGGARVGGVPGGSAQYTDLP